MSNSADRLRVLRKEKGIRQSDAADAMGISRPALSNYEKGMIPSIDNAIILAKYYGVSLDYIVGLSNERSQAAGSLGASFAGFTGLAGDKALTASDVLSFIDAATVYITAGSPCGSAPVDCVRPFLAHLSEAMLAAAHGDFPGVMEASNAAVKDALPVAQMPATMAMARRKAPVS